MTEQSENSRQKCWLADNVAPLLAILAVVITFALFVAFIVFVQNPYDKAERNAFDVAQNQYDAALLNKELLPEQIQIVKDAAANARVSLEGAKERHSTVKEIILYILGVLSSTITTIYGYYFGSSKSSSNKDATMHVLAKSNAKVDGA